MAEGHFPWILRRPRLYPLVPSTTPLSYILQQWTSLGLVFSPRRGASDDLPTFSFFHPHSGPPLLDIRTPFPPPRILTLELNTP